MGVGPTLPPPAPPRQGEQGRFVKDLAAKLVTLPWSEDMLARWRQNIQRADKVREEIAGIYTWDENLVRYTPQPRRDDVNAMDDFSDVERKKSALFNRTPTIALTNFPGATPDLQSATALRQLVLNAVLGPKECGGVGALRTVQQAIFDVLCPAGVGVTMVGYAAVTVEVERAVPVLGPDGNPMPLMDPATGQPVLGPQGEFQPQTQQQMVPVPIHETLFFDRASPKGLLLPAELRTTETETGAWIGVKWRKALSLVRREFAKDVEWQPGSSGQAPYFNQPNMVSSTTTVGGLPPADPEVSGTTIYYHPALEPELADRYPHPEIIATLVLIDGEDEPAEHRLLEWQTVTPEGALTPDSFLGFPIDPLMVRDLTDQCYVPSDCAATAALTIEKNRGRTINQDVRKSNRQIMLYDPQKLPEDKREAVRSGNVGSWVDVAPGTLDTGAGVNGIMAQAGQLQRNRQDYEWERTVDRDREKVLGISANAAGTAADRAQTATEVSAVERNKDARFETEHQRVMAWYLRQVKKLDVLLTRYGASLVPKLVGPLLAQAWGQTQPALGHYSYTIHPDAGKYQDIEAQRRQTLQLLNMIGKAPQVNTLPIIKDLGQSFGYDPKQLVIEQPPEPKPDPAKLSVSIKGEDLIPYAPQYAGVYAWLTSQGVQGLPPPVQLNPLTGQPMPSPPPQGVVPPSGAPPPIPGTLPRMEQLNQKQAQETGQRPGPPVEI